MPCRPTPTTSSAPPATRRRAEIRCSCTSSWARSSPKASLRAPRTSGGSRSSPPGAGGGPGRPRLSRLPPEATRLAQAVAILGDDVDPAPAAALAGLDEERASEAASDLARVDVLRPQAPLGFVHPLLRAAVYEALTPLEQRN